MSPGERPGLEVSIWKRPAFGAKPLERWEWKRRSGKPYGVRGKEAEKGTLRNNNCLEEAEGREASKLDPEAAQRFGETQEGSS